MKSEKPVISVVITAHDRKKYLLNAVNSILTQTLARNKFEIIVVKNFKDQYIDEILENEGIRIIFTDEVSFGAKLALGMKMSNGDIISFLDDDDSFTPDKLEIVLGSFNDNVDLNYFHNGIQEMDEEGFIKGNSKIRKHKNQTIILNSPISNLSDLSKLSRFRGDWYMSCISIKRTSFLPFIEFVGSISASLDRIFFMISLNLQGKIMMDSMNITKYRMHQSTTGIRSGFTEYCNKKKSFFERTFKSIRIAESFPSINNISNHYISIQKVHNKANSMLYDVKPQRLHRARIFVASFRAYNMIKDKIYIFIGILLLLSILSPKTVIFMHYIYQNSLIS